MPSTFTMEALENYDPANVTELDGGTQSACFALDPTCLACGYDYNGRNLLYLGLQIADFTPDTGPTSGSFTNPTGHSVYDGASNVIASGATISIGDTSSGGATNFWPQVFRKNIDTGVVTSFSIYDSSRTIPAEVGSVWPFISHVGSGYTTASVSISGGGGSGMQAVALLDAGGGGYVVNIRITDWGTGYTSEPTFSLVGDGTGAVIETTAYQTPSDGSYRWIGANFSVALPNGVNGPNLFNPYNSDFWISAESCELYQLRSSDSYAQVIAPAILAVTARESSFDTPTLYPAGVDETWCYGLTNAHGFAIFNGISLCLTPAAVQSDEIAASSKLTYVVWDSAPFSSDYGARLTFGTDGSIYVVSLGAQVVGGSTCFYWRLTQYVPPALATFGTNDPGVMTDQTPWGLTGPNAAAANYLAVPTASQTAASLLFALVRLPATNQLAAVLKMPKEASSDDPTNYANTLFSCVYVSLGNSPTYDYHSGFVTGYMDASWAPADSIPATGWAVVDCRETNNFLEQSDYIYDGIDYTKRWFVFQCYPISGSAVDTSNGLMAVLVRYQFVSGSPPSVLAVAIDPSWDANYPDYQTAISQEFIVSNSMLIGAVPTDNDNFINNAFVYPDPGIVDDSTNSFIFSGVTNASSTPSTPNANNMFYLDGAFTSRAAYNASGQPNNAYGPITPPFLKLTITPGVNQGQGYIYG